MKNILLAIDYTDTSKRTIAKALEIAERFTSRIWVMHVVDTSAYYGGGYGGVAATNIGVPEAGFVGMESGVPVFPDEQGRDLLLKAEQEKLQGIAGEIKSRGFQVEVIVSEGDAISAILNETKNLQIDLIVLGFHEHGFLYNTFVGSTTEEILKYSEVPMLIIPEDKQIT